MLVFQSFCLTCYLFHCIDFFFFYKQSIVNKLKRGHFVNSMELKIHLLKFTQIFCIITRLHWNFIRLLFKMSICANPLPIEKATFRFFFFLVGAAKYILNWIYIFFFLNDSLKISLSQFFSNERISEQTNICKVIKKILLHQLNTIWQLMTKFTNFLSVNSEYHHHHSSDVRSCDHIFLSRAVEKLGFGLFAKSFLWKIYLQNL